VDAPRCPGGTGGRSEQGEILVWLEIKPGQAYLAQLPPRAWGSGVRFKIPAGAGSTMEGLAKDGCDEIIPAREP
jgi:hypothetical protein